MRCMALIRQKMTESEWKKDFAGKVVSKPIGMRDGVASDFARRCQVDAGHAIERQGMVFQVCGNHTRDNSCLIADFGRKREKITAVVENDEGVTFIDTTTGKEVTQLKMDLDDMKINPEYDNGIVIVAFTGHRPQKLGGYEPNPLRTKVKYAMMETMQHLQVQYHHHELVVMSGGALGVDQWAMQMAQHMGLKHVVAAPFFDQAKVWPAESKKLYKDLCDAADPEISRLIVELLVPRYRSAAFDPHTNRIIVCDGEYAGWKMQKRNEFMVDSALELVAVWDGTTGGTRNCVRYAEKTLLPAITQINPRNL